MVGAESAKYGPSDLEEGETAIYCLAAGAVIKLDKDGNGSISKEEFMASPGAKKDATKAEERFGKMDKNKDGSLSKEEMTPKKKAAK